jgi:NADH dehydrogenase [ubiquinone] 1 alpha subcomplex assembly factor 5
MIIFNRSIYRIHRDRASKKLDQHDFLLSHILEDLVERINDYNQKYETVLDLGCFDGKFSKIKSKLKIKQLIQTDISYKMLQKANGQRIQADEEFLPFADNSFDLIVSNLNLHWVNDLPGTLLQVSRILKPKGIFVASIIGGKSLIELRKILIEAEEKLGHQISSHISPMIDAVDASTLLQRAKFLNPITDSTVITVSYPNLITLLLDLRGMAQSNCLVNPSTLSSKTLDLAESLYKRQYGESGKILANFEIITLWGSK